MSKTADFDVMDALLYAAAPYAGQNELNEYMEAEVPEFDVKAQKRIYKKLNKEFKYYSNHDKYSPVAEAFKRVAIIILIVMSVGFTCILSIEAAREAIWQAIVEWAEHFIYFKYTNETETEFLTEIKEYKEPAVDDIFERHEIRKNTKIYNVEYETDSELITYTQRVIEKINSYLTNSNTELTEIYIGEHKAFKSEYISNGELYINIKWNDGIYYYSISGNITYEELLELAESIN